MKHKKCPFCSTSIPHNFRQCPYCFRRQPRVRVLILIILACAAVAAWIYFKPVVGEKSQPAVPVPAATITETKPEVQNSVKTDEKKERTVRVEKKPSFRSVIEKAQAAEESQAVKAQVVKEPQAKESPEKVSVPDKGSGLEHPDEKVKTGPKEGTQPPPATGVQEKEPFSELPSR